ncbi:MAG: C13 family peptidase [Gammaproteobacteria bacterium]
MNHLLTDFKSNLKAGLRFALFRPCNTADFKCNFDQLALLLALDIALEIASDFVLNSPEPRFNSYALTIYTFSLACFFLAAYVAGKLAHNDAAPLRIGVMVYSFAPLTTALQLLITFINEQPPFDEIETYDWLYAVFSLYAMLLLGRALYLAAGRLKSVTAAAFIVMMGAIAIPHRYFANDAEFWYVADADDYSGEDSSEQQDPYAAYRALDAEKLLYRQPEILARALNKMTAQRNHISDLFFVGFAGDAHQDVFSKEVAYAKQIFDDRFDTRGHSLTLVNHLQTADTLPLATETNLGLALKRIGNLMNRDEDILVLYLTSHGSKTHELAVDFWPLPLNAITPEKLNKLLKEAGIKWRVVIVSACYSGGFVEALQGPYTLVATAAASDRTSFGCGNEFDFTYFGEALFKDQLQQQTSLITALQQAKLAIGRREKREHLEPSLPQLSVGAAIEAKLQRLGWEFHKRQCNGGTVSETNRQASLCSPNGSRGRVP